MRTRFMEPFRIMFVDDDIDQIRLWQTVAEQDETIFSIRKGAISALEWLKNVNYEVDAIIMDLSMPDMDGITLTEQIRKNETIRSIARPIEIFWFTGWVYDETNTNNPVTIAQKKYNIRKVWYKPEDPLTVLNAVREFLSGAADKEREMNA